MSQPLHDYSLKRLMEIGPKHPIAFKNIMQSAPLLKQQLENAIKAGQSVVKSASALPGGHRGSGQTVTQQQQPPSIKLKMDFSNFK